MDAERWHRIESLCEGALSLSREDQTTYLVRECGVDEELRLEVQDLLDQLQEDPHFLETPIARLDLPMPADPPTPATIPVIDGWTVIHRLGVGGMGEVYLAEPAEGGEPVAIKSLRKGVNTADLVRRFGLERQILANLSHPNIARLIDVTKTTDGRPCFVMEYVRGVTITAHADLKRLGIRDRLNLMLAICSAVDHAHRNLIVHRDLKPANILVAEDGTAKLLDFGIGKVLEGAFGLGPVFDTTADSRLLTLDYASPEQLRGEVVTTATDVHALGIILHELLTGSHPFRNDDTTPGQLERAILEQPPEFPSDIAKPTQSSGPVAQGDLRTRAEARGMNSPEALSRRLSGDLDNIVLMALRKEPARRYPSVAALAEDIHRHLDGRPVLARPDTLGYRARRFVRRNAGSVAVATLAALGLLATTAVALTQSQRATRNAIAVRASRDEAVEVRGFLMEMFGATGSEQDVGGSESVRQLLDRQATRIDSTHPDNPLLAARLHEVVADAYDRLGLSQSAASEARLALTLRRGIQGDRHPDVAAAENLLGWILHEAGERTEAEQHLEAALAIRNSATPLDSGGLGRTLNDLGVLYNSMNRYAEAESVLVRALAIRKARSDEEGLTVGITANNLAAAYYYQAKYPEAGSTQLIAVRAIEGAVGPDHQRSVVALNNLAAFQIAAGKTREAEATYRTLLERQTRLQGVEHPTTLLVMTSLASALSARAEGDDRKEALKEADSLLTIALAIQRRADGTGKTQLGVTLDRLAGIHLAMSDAAGALTFETEAVVVLRALHGSEHREVAAATVRLGLIHARLGHAAEALRLGSEGMSGLIAALGEDHPTTARGRGRFCLTLVSIGDNTNETDRVCRRAIADLETAPAGYARDLAEVRGAVEKWGATARKR